MTMLFSSFGITFFAVLVISGHGLAQRMRGAVAAGAGRRRMPSGGASYVA